MIYPDFMKKGDTIGITACSDGKDGELDFRRMDYAKVQFDQVGYQIFETDNCRTSSRGRSADVSERVQQFEILLNDETVSAIIMCSGGDYLLEILSELDYTLIQKKKKWIQGFSDPTGLLYTITVQTGLATVYGGNYGDFGMAEWHDSLYQNIQLLDGTWDQKEGFIQKSFEAFQDGFIDKKTGLEGFLLNKKVQWKNVNTEGLVKAKGRMLGGCLDVLLNIVGTKYDKTIDYLNQYKEDGIIWYLESFDLNSERLYLGLWNLKESGWFDTANAFVFGRPTFFGSGYDIGYEETLLDVLGACNVPILSDVCFGHKPPRMTIVNGALGEIESVEGKGCLKQFFI